MNICAKFEEIPEGILKILHSQDCDGRMVKHTQKRNASCSGLKKKSRDDIKVIFISRIFDIFELNMSHLPKKLMYVLCYYAEKKNAKLEIGNCEMLKSVAMQQPSMVNTLSLTALEINSKCK